MTRFRNARPLCSSLAFALCVAPSLPVLAATTSAATSAPDGEAVPGPDGDPEALSAEAVEKFQAKQYDDAVALFEQAYAIDPQPNYLFNIGRVYEEKGDLENAVKFYQRFVSQGGVDIESRQVATERLKVLRETIKAMKEDEEPADQDGSNKPPPEDDVTDDNPPDDITDDGADEDAKRKRTLRITGYTLLGVGGAALIVGGVMGGLASGNADDANTDPFIDRKIALRDRARTQARVADAMFITGGVLAATGLVLVLVTLGKKKSAGDDAVARRTTWSPVIGGDRVGLGLTHRF